jgi:hypothetical protein
VRRHYWKWWEAITEEAHSSVLRYPCSSARLYQYVREPQVLHQSSSVRFESPYIAFILIKNMYFNLSIWMIFLLQSLTSCMLWHAQGNEPYARLLVLCWAVWRKLPRADLLQNRRHEMGSILSFRPDEKRRKILNLQCEMPTKIN